jgi:hypothetical protein
LGSGHLRIAVSHTGGAVVRGVALVVERTAGDATVASTAAVTATSLNTFIDYAFTAGAGYTAIGQGHPAAIWNAHGVATFPAESAKFSVCAGFLDQAGHQAGVTTDSFFDIFYTQGVASSATIAMSLDTLRGGIVGDTLGTVTVQATQGLVFGYTLTTASDAHCDVTVPGEGTYSNQTGLVTITAGNFTAGWHFAGWTGNITNITNASAASTTINMIANASITATSAQDAETITTPTVAKTTAAPAIAGRVNGGRVETFVASGAVSSYSDALEYLFIWGDTPVNTTWGAATQTHTYTYAAAATYSVTVQARCIAHPTVLSAVSAVQTEASECVRSTAAFYATWAQFVRPNCWGFQRNCRGDANGAASGGGANRVWVNSTDLSIFSAAYNLKEAPLAAVVVGGVPGICADNNRAASGGGANRVWVNSTDLGIFSTYYNLKEASVPVCSGPATNYWYWTN